MGKRAVLYARVSGDDRAKEGRNLQGQLDLCREFCREKGYRIVAELAEDDRGASGASWDLPMLNKALDMARAGEFDVLVTRELDRFARSLAKQLVIEDEFKRYGVEVEYVLAEYDDSPEGRLNKHIRATIAEFEREKINQRMIRGRRQKVKAGNIMVHGNPPFGYEIHKEGNKTSLMICEQEAEIVRTVFDLYVGDDKPSICEVAKRMTGTPTCTDLRQNPSNPKIRTRGAWSIGSVSNILGNQVYTGVWTYADDPDLTVEIPIIISQETWEKAQERKERNGEFSRRNAKYTYLMGKRLTCKECNSKMVGRSKKGRSKLYLYYVCQAKHRFARKCAVTKCFRADLVDRAVWDWINDLFSDPERLADLVQDFIQSEEKSKQNLIDRVETANRLLEGNYQKLRRLLNTFLDNPSLPKEWLTEKRNSLEGTIWSLEYELANLDASLRSWQSYKEYYTEIAGDPERWKNFVMNMGLGTSNRDEIIEKLDVRGTLYVDGGDEKIHVRCTLGESVLSIGNKNICSR